MLHSGCQEVFTMALSNSAHNIFLRFILLARFTSHSHPNVMKSNCAIALGQFLLARMVWGDDRRPNLQVHRSVTDQKANSHRRTVVGGTDADPKRYPYFARLDYEGEFGCGATLIHKDFLLTAAHCVFPEDLGILNAYIGAVDHSEDGGLSVPVTQIFQHEAYEYLSTSTDIALVQIESVPDEFLRYILPLASDRNLLQHGDSVTVIGLGLTQDGGEDAEVLQEVEVKIVDDETCDAMYDGDIHRKSMICAGDVSQDACEGDSGGPLILLGESPADDIQVGVVSWGERCGDEAHPGVYADVAYTKGWIDSIICKHSASPPEGCKITDTGSAGPIIVGSDMVCRDFDGAFYADWWHQFRRCEWLQEKDGRIGDYCYEANEAWIRCPFTCHSCTYEADDDYMVGDDWTDYNRSSSPLAFIFVFIFTGVFLCLIGFWIKRNYCKECYLYGCRRSKTSDLAEISAAVEYPEPIKVQIDEPEFVVDCSESKPDINLPETSGPVEYPEPMIFVG
jgi:prostatin (serine protease 8)